MPLARAGANYEQRDEQEIRNELDRRDGLAHKRDRNLELRPGQKLTGFDAAGERWGLSYAGGGGLVVTNTETDIAYLHSPDDWVNINSAEWGGGVPVGDGDVSHLVADTDAYIAAWEAALAYGRPMALGSNKSFVIGETQSASDQNMALIGNDSRLLQYMDAPLMDWAAPYTNITAIASIDNAAPLDLSGEGDGLTYVAKLEVPTLTNFAVNQDVKVFANNAILNGDPNEREGENAVIAALEDGATKYIYLYKPLRAAARLTDNPRIAIFSSAPRLYMERVKLANHESANVSWNRELVTVTGGKQQRFIDVEVERSLTLAFFLRGTLRPAFMRPIAANLRTRSANGSLGYFVLDSSGDGLTMVGGYGRKLRHFVTTGIQGGAADNTDVWRYGRSRNGDISYCAADECDRQPFDTHSDGEDYTFTRCKARNPIVGPGGSRRNFVIRGRGIQLIDCESEGAIGVEVRAQFDDEEAGRKTIVRGHKHTSAVTDTLSDYAYKVDGAVTDGTPQILFDSCGHDMNGSSARTALIENGHAHFENLNVLHDRTLTGEAKQIVLGEGAVVTGQGGSIDYKDASTATRIVFDLSEDGVSLHWDGLRLRNTAGAVLSAVADLTGTADGDAIVTNVTTDAAPTALTIGSSSGDVWVTMFLHGDRSGLPLPESVTIASGAIDVHTSHVIVDTEAAAASDDLATINGGLEGVAITLRAANDARTVVVKNAVDNIFNGADFSLDHSADLGCYVKRGDDWFKMYEASNA